MKINYCLFGLFITIVLVILSTAHDYKKNQNELVTESNQLYSQNNKIINVRFEQLRSNTRLNTKPFCLFYEVDNKLSLTIRAVYSNHYPSFQPPLAKGTFFKDTQEKQALIGRKVPRIKENNCEFFVFNKQKYKVIGYLGKKIPSNFNYDVLINDLSYFNQQTQSYVIDTDSKEILQALDKKSIISTHYSGVNRLVDVDFFSPLLLIFSKIMSIGIIIIATYIFQKSISKELYVLQLLGMNLKKHYFYRMFQLNMLFFLLTGCVFVVYYFIQKMRPISYFTDVCLYFLIMNSCFFIAYFIDKKKVTFR